ncbi:MAG: kelch repeat-containing protein [Acidobacteriota bacterium]
MIRRRSPRQTSIESLVVSALVGLAAAASFGYGNEPPTAWQLIDEGEPSQSPQWLVYDNVRSRTTQFNFAGSGQTFRTWFLQGNKWTRHFAPPAAGTFISCATFDRSRGVIVAYSSRDTVTWEFDGVAWTRITTTLSPSKRALCNATFDERRGRVVLFGGYDEDGGRFLDDTWEYDGTNWTQILTPSRPGRRWRAGMTYDSQRQVAVLFGGSRDGGIVYNDLWEYNGTSWTQRNPGTFRPSPRFAMGIAYDSVRRRTVIFGGATSTIQYDETWEWNGTNWTRPNPVVKPAARLDGHMVFDEGRSKVVMYDGTVGEKDYGDTWTYDGTTWQQIAIVNAPSPRSVFGMTFDSTVGKVVLYGGSNLELTPLSDTWLWSHQTGWERSTSTEHPPSTAYAQLAFSALTSKTVEFGGDPTDAQASSYHAPLDQWTVLGPQPPSARFRHSWAATPTLGGILLFGGDLPWPKEWGNDTWLFDGINWTEYQPLVRPTERGDAVVSEFGIDGRAYLYGGVVNNELVRSDFWRFDGVNWELLADPAPPGGRRAGSMVYDPERRRLILIGGGYPLEGRVWEWDGTLWISKPQSFEPETHRCGIQAVWYPPKSVVLLIGGRTCSAALIDNNDIWAYGLDPDQDGKVGGFDNCATVVNVGQENVDDDLAGDACDCAASDANVFAIPPAVTGLRWSSPTLLRWDSVVPNAGAASVHDARRGSLSEFPVGSGGTESCLGYGITGVELTDATTPASGTGFWYLVRGRNSCGSGSWGTTSAGQQRAPGGCP